MNVKIGSHFQEMAGNKLASRTKSPIPTALTEDLRLSHGAVVVYCLLLGSRFDEDDITVKSIMQRGGIKKPATVSKYWKELEDTGWISREKSGRGYIFTLYSDPEEVRDV